MSAFICLASVLEVSQAPIKIGWTIWCCLSLLSTLLSVRFVWFIYHNKYKPEIKKYNKRFYLLAMIASITIACAQLGTLPASLFWINQFHPNLNIDYENDLQCGTLGFYETIQTVFAPMSAITNDTSYISILTVYYTRLVLIFQGSIFQVLNGKQLLFRILITSKYWFENTLPISSTQCQTYDKVVGNTNVISDILAGTDFAMFTFGPQKRYTSIYIIYFNCVLIKLYNYTFDLIVYVS